MDAEIEHPTEVTGENRDIAEDGRTGQSKDGEKKNPSQFKE